MEFKIDVIIPLYGEWQSVNGIVKKLEYREDFNIIIVNDGYSAREEKPSDKINVKYFYKGNGGFASAVNYGVKRGNAEYIAIFNTDVSFKEDILDKLFECLKSGDYDIVMPAIYDKNGNIESLGMKRILGNMWVMRRNKNEPLNSLPFTAVLLKRGIWGNGLDERFYMYYEDIDFFVNRNVKMACCDNASIVHYSSSSIKHKYYWQHRARWMFWKKNSRNLPWWNFTLYLIWDTISLIRSVFGGYLIDAVDTRLKMKF